jgi:hypothetical protein
MRKKLQGDEENNRYTVRIVGRLPLPDIESNDTELSAMSVSMDPDSLNQDMNPDPAFQVNPNPDPIQIQGFDEQNLKRKKIQQKCILFIKSCNLSQSYRTGEAFCPQKRIYQFFSMFFGHFCTPGSGSTALDIGLGSQFIAASNECASIK